MWRSKTVTWSPCEIDWLKANRSERSVNELSLYLGKSRNAVKLKLDELDGKPAPMKKNKISRIGKRDDIKKNNKPQFFRSGWEANIARWFSYKGEKWEYEPEVFFYESVKHGTVSYCPDFKTDSGWIEVKGMLDGHGQAAVRRFKKFYPDEFKKLKAVVGRKNTKADKFFKKIGVPILAYMEDLNKEFKNIVPHWE